MAKAIDYTPLDLPQISQRMFFPQRLWSPAPAGATDHFVPAEPGVELSARYYPLDAAGSPTIIFFHGNGEVACQYDDLAPFYAKVGASLFVADFRGYGQSDGSPSFSSMIRDASAVFRYCRELLDRRGVTGPLFVMGRSMGCHSAVELAARFPAELRGLISESGSAAVARTMERWGLSQGPWAEELVRLHQAKVRSISLPLLTIHGEQDELIPMQSAVDLYEAVSSQDKSFEVIPGAGHNDLLWLGQEQYFEAVRRFVSAHGQV